MFGASEVFAIGDLERVQPELVAEVAAAPIFAVHRRQNAEVQAPHTRVTHALPTPSSFTAYSTRRCGKRDMHSDQRASMCGEGVEREWVEQMAY